MKTPKNKLSSSEVKHVAKLAGLTLTEAEVKKFQAQLSEVLDYIDILKEVPTENIEPTSQVTLLENVFRQDRAGDCLNQKEVLSEAGKTHKGLFRIKRILDND
ncbi:Asp-tRNA(Asn)/Glu-tRNA(Gln) amidotransferase subunit GatC [Candidatus Shapirobacteria bacterium]|nr:Asp-tRNA(Asn)/Glu-tRNA(Gln) amidotransferase subunit GatC [Candidatus Shapirobacteria bacterium]